MKTVIVFLLCSCLFFVGKHGRADVHHCKSACYSVQDNKERQKSIIANSSGHLPVVRKTEAVVSLEDEDEGPVFNRKYVLLATYLIVTNIYGFGDLCNGFKNRIPFCTHFSNTASKYILQRVLRI